MKTLGGLCRVAVVLVMLCASVAYGAPVEVIGDLFVKDPEPGVPAGIIFGDQSRQEKACYGTVTSVTAGSGLISSPGLGITTTGSLSVDTTLIQSRVTGACADLNNFMKVVNPDGSVQCGQVIASGATVTSVSSGSGLIASPNPIITTGSLSVDTSYVQRRVSGVCPASQYVRSIESDGLVTCGTDAGGTVTSVGAGFGLTGGPITTSGALAVDFAGSTGIVNTAARSDHTHNYDAGYVNAGGDTMTGALTLPANGLVAGVTQLVLNSGNVGIGIAAPAEKLHLVGNLKMGGDLKTDRWQNSDTNTLMGVGVAGKGDLTLGVGLSGLYNTAVGGGALHSINDGHTNTALGYGALYSTTSGTGNVAVGDFALWGNIAGHSNVALGNNALYSNISGAGNVAVGPSAGESSTGSGNVFLGNFAGYGQTGSNRLYIASSTMYQPLIYGQFDTGKVCIGCTDPAAALDVNGPVTVRTGDVKLSGTGGGVVFPDGSKQTTAGGYVRTVLVSPGETAVESGTRLLAALAGITDNSPTKPYLVKIEPGNYDVGSTAVHMKQYVDIEGSGERVTVITGAIGSSLFPPSNATVMGADNAEIRFLTVKNTGGGYNVVAMVNYASPKVTNVTVSASGGTVTVGVVNDSSSPTMTNVTVDGSAVDYSYGVLNRSSSATMTNVTATASGGNHNSYGIHNVSCTAASILTMTNVAAVGKDGTSNFGVHNVDCPETSALTMTNVTATASGGSINYGVYNDSSFPRMTNVTATASGGSSFNSGVYNESSSPTMTNVTATASGGSSFNSGVFNGSSSPTMTNVTATASGGSSNYGVYNASSSPTMTNVTAITSGGSSNYGVYNGSSSLTMSNVVAVAKEGTTNNGMVNSAPYGVYTILVDRSTFEGSTNSISNDTEFTLLIGASKLVGAKPNNLGTYSCAGVYWLNTSPLSYTMLNSICQ